MRSGNWCWAMLDKATLKRRVCRKFSPKCMNRMDIVVLFYPLRREHS